MTSSETIRPGRRIPAGPARLAAIAGLVAGPLAVLASTAAAAPLLLLQDGRQLDSDVIICDSFCDSTGRAVGSAAPPAPFAAWQSQLLEPGFLASQSSSATTTQLAGSGTAAFDFALEDPAWPGWIPQDQGLVHSIYEVEFGVTQPTRISLNGTLSLGGQSPDTGEMNFASYELRSETTVLAALSVNAYQGDADGDHPFQLVETLAPDVYRLRLVASGDYGVTRSSRFEFTMDVPEPGTGHLLGLALLGVLGLARPGSPIPVAPRLPVSRRQRF